ncbi:hypothetical protein SUDANB145_03245 [Streptomyces sp. enrichment culture]
MVRTECRVKRHLSPQIMAQRKAFQDVGEKRGLQQGPASNDVNQPHSAEIGCNPANRSGANPRAAITCRHVHQLDLVRSPASLEVLERRDVALLKDTHVVKRRHDLQLCHRNEGKHRLNLDGKATRTRQRARCPTRLGSTLPHVGVRLAAYPNRVVAHPHTRTAVALRVDAKGSARTDQDVVDVDIACQGYGMQYSPASPRQPLQLHPHPALTGQSGAPAVHLQTPTGHPGQHPPPEAGCQFVHLRLQRVSWAVPHKVVFRAQCLVHYRQRRSSKVGSEGVEYRVPLLLDQKLQRPRAAVEPGDLRAVRLIHVETVMSVTFPHRDP